MLSIILAVLLQLPVAAGIIPAKLVKAVSPLSPPNTAAGTCVLADVPVNRQGRAGEIKILRGLGAFTDSATTAIKQWEFTGAPLVLAADAIWLLSNPQWSRSV